MGQVGVHDDDVVARGVLETVDVGRAQTQLTRAGPQHLQPRKGQCNNQRFLFVWLHVSSKWLVFITSQYNTFKYSHMKSATHFVTYIQYFNIHPI